MPTKTKIILYFLAIIKAIIFPIHARQKEHKDDDYKKAKLQTTLLKFGGVWILHLEILEFEFYLL